MTRVLILGSGPDVTACSAWPRAPFDVIVAINNAWQVRPDWDYAIFPEDFPAERQPPPCPRTRVEAADFVPAQNAFGGVIYTGGTMAFTAGYWALHALHPRAIAFLGCNMVYAPTGQTHFYGTGTPDPLREDPTLQSLQAKSARLMIHAARQGCPVVNLSNAESRLIFPRARPDTLPDAPIPFDTRIAAQADAREDALGYMVASGRYWEDPDACNPTELRKVDALWLAAAGG